MGYYLIQLPWLMVFAGVTEKHLLTVQTAHVCRTAEAPESLRLLKEPAQIQHSTEFRDITGKEILDSWGKKTNKEESTASHG